MSWLEPLMRFVLMMAHRIWPSNIDDVEDLFKSGF